MKRFFSAESFSYTKKNEHTTLYVSKEVLQKGGDRILFVDDFYARGNTLKAIKKKIIEQAEATLVAVPSL